jgi:hypothetical protein
VPRCPSCHRRLAAGARCPRDGAEVAAAPVLESGAPPVALGFEIDGPPLGSGGFATTWPAVRITDGARAALKVSRVPSLAAAARLAREAEALVKVGSPVTPKVFAHGRTVDGRAFLAMEWIKGSLLSNMMDSGPLVPWRVGRLASLLCAAVAAIHRAGEVHRDLKPENLFFTPGQMRVIDFGLGAATPEYAAPEQMRGGEASAASDVYAIGAIVYELLTGRPPFVGDAAAIQYGVLSLRPAAPSAIADVPTEVDALVMQCLEKDPSRRPADVAALGGQIEAALRNTGDGRPETGGAKPETAAHKVIVIVAVKGGSVDAVTRRRGVVVGKRGELVVCAFTPDAVDDPARAARRAAEEMVREGRRSWSARRSNRRPGRLRRGRGCSSPTRWLRPRAPGALHHHWSAVTPSWPPPAPASSACSASGARASAP